VTRLPARTLPGAGLEIVGVPGAGVEDGDAVGEAASVADGIGVGEGAGVAVGDGVGVGVGAAPVIVNGAAAD
jgi:hypothetical protein